MKALFLTKYSINGASSRYRTLQYLPFFESEGWSCEISPLFSYEYLVARYKRGRPPISYVLRGFFQRLQTAFRMRQYDLVVIEKELFPYLPGFFERMLLKTARAYTLDFDDALFHIYDQHRSPFVCGLLSRKFSALITGARMVTVGNSYLSAYARDYADRVEILPTVIDMKKYSEGSEPIGKFTIGWIGTPNTAKYLHLIAKPLKHFFRQRRAQLLLIGAGDGFALEGVPAEVLPWSEEREVIFLQRSHVGIMPLPDLPLERGKSGLKLLQYMAAGRPVIASPVGVNTELVAPSRGFLASSDEAWLEYFLRLADDAVLRRSMGETGRQFVEQHYNLATWGPHYARLLRSVVEGRAISEPVHI